MKCDWVKRAKKVLTPALVFHTDVVAKKAKGIHVIDINGKRYMDFSSGLAVANTGHNHPDIVSAIKNQTDSVLHSGCIFYHEPLVALSERLKKITPQGLDMFFFGNSGTEAVEGSLKLARFYTKRQGIISFTNSFHGRTFGSLSLTASNSRFRRNYHPLLPSVYHSPYPYCYRCFFGHKPEECGMECCDYIEKIFKHLIPAEEVACIIIEPVLGEGGYVVPPEGFLKRLRFLCDKWGILLIFDEVQSGMGRTGKWFASEHFGVVPDIMAIAKGLASGMPLSAIAAKKKIMTQWSPGAHGTTFGGNPVSCAAAIATIEVIEKEKLLSNAASVGAYAIKRLNEMKEKYACIGDVRGLGLMIGIEFMDKKGKPFTDGVKKILNYCLKKGLILIECGADKNVIRLVPPLISTKNEMDKGLAILEEAIRNTAGTK